MDEKELERVKQSWAARVRALQDAELAVAEREQRVEVRELALRHLGSDVDCACDEVVDRVLALIQARTSTPEHDTLRRWETTFLQLEKRSLSLHRLEEQLRVKEEYVRRQEVTQWSQARPQAAPAEIASLIDAAAESTGSRVAQSGEVERARTDLYLGAVEELTARLQTLADHMQHQI